MVVIGSGRAKRIWKRLSPSERARLRLYFQFVAKETKILNDNVIKTNAIRNNISLKSDREADNVS
jgi:hypothetical protein